MFARIDFFGKPVEFNFNGKDRSQSSAGACFTIILFAFICCSIYQIGKDLINRLDPKTITSEFFYQNPAPMVLSADTFNFGFSLQHPMTLEPYINESIYTVEARWNQLKRIVREDGKIEMNWTKTLLNIERCNKLHFGDLAPKFENIELNALYCLQANQSELEEIRIQGVLESPIFEYISIMVKQCNNQTSMVPCAPKEILNQVLEGGGFTTHFPNLAIEPKNFSNPNSGYMDSLSTSVSRNYSKELTFWLNHVEMATDSGWVLSEVKNDHYIKLDHSQEYINFRSVENEIINFIIRVGKITKHYERSYIKVQDLIADINGLVSISFILGYIFIMPYSNLKFYERMTNELFDVKTLAQTKKANKSNPKRYSKRGKTCLKIDGDKSEDEENEQDITDQLIIQPQPRNQNSLAAALPRSSNISFLKTDALNQNQSSWDHSLPTKEALAVEKDSSCSDSKKNRKSVRFVKTKSQQDKSKEAPKIQILDKIIESDSKAFHPHLLKEKPKITDQPKIRAAETIEIQCRTETFGALEVVIDKTEPNKPNEDPEKERKHTSIDSNLDVTKNEEHDFECQAEGVQFGQYLDEIEISKRAEMLPTQLTKDSYHIDITFKDYICSYIWKTKSLKQKLGLLQEGTRRIQERLNIFNLLKKLRELDKIKLLLLEDEQLMLFDALPNPELSMNVNSKKKIKRDSFHRLKEAAFIAEKRKNELIKASYIDLKKKNNPSMIDQILLEIYDEILDS